MRNLLDRKSKWREEFFSRREGAAVVDGCGCVLFVPVGSVPKWRVINPIIFCLFSLDGTHSQYSGFSLLSETSDLVSRISF